MIPTVLLIFVLVSISGCTVTNTFDQGKVSFQIPNEWTNDHVTGDFSTALFSETAFTSNLQDESGRSQTAYIMVQMRKIGETGIDIESVQVGIRNTTNATIQTVKVGDGINAREFATSNPNVANKMTMFTTDGYEYIIELICPPSVLNQAEEDYNTILKTFKVS